MEKQLDLNDSQFNKGNILADKIIQKLYIKINRKSLHLIQHKRKRRSCRHSKSDLTGLLHRQIKINSKIKALSSGRSSSSSLRIKNICIK